MVRASENYFHLHSLILFDVKSVELLGECVTLKTVEFSLLHLPLIQHLEVCIDARLIPESYKGVVEGSLPQHP